jgi:hypothetical protein
LLRVPKSELFSSSHQGKGTPSDHLVHTRFDPDIGAASLVSALVTTSRSRLNKHCRAGLSLGRRHWIPRQMLRQRPARWLLRRSNDGTVILSAAAICAAVSACAAQLELIQ